MKTESILKRYDKSPANLLAILHDIQNGSEQHYLSQSDLAKTARFLELPLSTVHGVATFYSLFSLKPRGRHLIRICQSPPCQLMGATSVSLELMKALGIHLGETTADGLFTLEMTSCLGVCGVAPAMMIDDQVYGNLQAVQIPDILADVWRGK